MEKQSVWACVNGKPDSACFPNGLSISQVKYSATPPQPKTHGHHIWMRIQGAAVRNVVHIAHLKRPMLFHGTFLQIILFQAMILPQRGRKKKKAQPDNTLFFLNTVFSGFVPCLMCVLQISICCCLFCDLEEVIIH